MIRPRPPADLTGIEGALKGPTFTPAPDLLEWVTSTFIVEDGPLANPDHAHLAMAGIGVLWTNAPNSRHGRDIVGQAEFKPPAVIGKWARARAQAQLYGWFGSTALDFLLTFYASYAAACSDIEFCALVEHELYHCGQQRDEFGAPCFIRDTGLPVFCMRGHDVEQFTGVVKRYGADAAGVRALVDAATVPSVIDGEKLAIACGTCT